MIFSGGKIIAPHKIHQLYFKRVSLTFTEEMAHYVNTGKFPASLQGVEILILNFDI